MKNSSKKSSRECTLVEDILIKKEMKNCSNSEFIFLEDHLKTCVSCRQYEVLLTQIRSSVKDYLETEVEPDRQIKTAVLKEYKRVQKVKNMEWRNFREKFKKILGYPIPLYQAMIGIAVIVMLFGVEFELNHPITSQPTFPENIEFFADTTYQEQLNIIKDIQILKKQNIGRTFHEDSVLTSFIVKLL